MKRLAALAGVVVALSTATGTARSSEPGAQPPSLPLVGIVGNDVYQQLVRFDPRTLRPLPGRVWLAGHSEGWSFSPGGRELVLGGNNQSCVGGGTGLRFADVRRMRTLGDVKLVANGTVEATAWPDATHVLAVVAVSDCLVTKGTVVFSVDAVTHCVLSEAAFPGDLLGDALARGKLVLLLGPRNGIGRARIATVDALGHVRETVLGQIDAGRVLPTATMGSSLVRLDVPGLAVDAGSGTAYVLPAGNRVAEIDLNTLRVSYHPLSERTSIFARFLHWLDPTAQAKGDDGPTRQAIWLGNGLLAVTGTDSSLTTRADGAWSNAVTPAGLRIIDTRTWTYRTLDSQVSQVQLGAGLMLATGTSYSSQRTSSGTYHSDDTYAGVIAYTLAGNEQYRLFNGTEVDDVAAIDGRGYAALGGAHGGRTTAFALTTGKPGRTYQTPLYGLLLSGQAPLNFLF